MSSFRSYNLDVVDHLEPVQTLGGHEEGPDVGPAMRMTKKSKAKVTLTNKHKRKRKHKHNTNAHLRTTVAMASTWDSRNQARLITNELAHALTFIHITSLSWHMSALCTLVWILFLKYTEAAAAGQSHRGGHLHAVEPLAPVPLSPFFFLLPTFPIFSVFISRLFPLPIRINEKRLFFKFHSSKFFVIFFKQHGAGERVGGPHCESVGSQHGPVRRHLHTPHW